MLRRKTMLEVLLNPPGMDSFYEAIAQAFRFSFYWTSVILSAQIIIGILGCLLEWLRNLLKTHLQNRREKEVR